MNIIYISVSMPTPWEVAGPNGQLASILWLDQRGLCKKNVHQFHEQTVFPCQNSCFLLAKRNPSITLFPNLRNNRNQPGIHKRPTLITQNQSGQLQSSFSAIKNEDSTPKNYNFSQLNNCKIHDRRRDWVRIFI